MTFYVSRLLLSDGFATASHFDVAEYEPSERLSMVPEHIKTSSADIDGSGTLTNESGLQSFSLTGDRELLDAERARVLFAPLKKLGSTNSDSSTELELDRLSLSGKSFDAGAAAVAAEHFARLRPRSLRVLHLADVIAGRPESEALKVLELLATALADHDLVELDMSDNALGAKGVRACAALLRRSERLESLVLCNNGLAADAIQLVVTVITQDGKQVALRKLHLFNNLLQDDGAIALVPLLERARMLEDFRFASLRVSRRGAAAISQALARGSMTLKRLDMTDNTLGADGARALADALTQQTDLEELYLRDCLLTNAGARCILEALLSHGEKLHLRVLDLSGNELTGVACGSLLAELVERCLATLTHLRLDENELGDEGALALAKALSKSPERSRLVEMSLYLNEIGGRAAVVLVQRCVRIASLRILNLNGNRISSTAQAYIERLVQDTPLEAGFVELDENDVSDDNEDADEEAIEQLATELASLSGDAQCAPVEAPMRNLAVETSDAEPTS
jgi:Ran GTPase-activating protein (RanGAP) involved in mRNA processing and transport